MRGDAYLDSVIRKVKDFPKKGILFYDITGLIQNPKAFGFCIDKMVDAYKGKGLDAIACIESRGFLLAAPLALRLGLPLILIRKKGKLPGELLEKTYALEYGEDTIQVKRDDIHKGDKILIVDDLIATGGTVQASISLLREAGAQVDEVFCLIGLPFLHYEADIDNCRVNTFIMYDSE